MPSVGSTPTTQSPAAQYPQQQHAKLQQQHSLPLQLQYQHHQPQVTTTQPSPAGTSISQACGIITTAAAAAINDGADISPLSSSNSFSSIDTNHTLLNTIVSNQRAQQQQQFPGATNNSAYRTKYSQFMIITPAVSIDRDFENKTATTAFDSSSAQQYQQHHENGNNFHMSLLQSSIDSGNSSDSSSFRSNYNPYIHNSRLHLLPKTPPSNYSAPTWRWCTLICAAMRCFGSGSHAAYSTSFARPPYQRSRSGGIQTDRRTTTTPHRRLRTSNSFSAEYAFEHFSAPFTPRKTRDHMNNVTYEL